MVYELLSPRATVCYVMPLARSSLPGFSMVWKAFWDTPRGDGTLPSSFVPRTMQSYLDRFFYIEDALTIFIALVAAFVLPGFPSTPHRWLSPVEVRLAGGWMGEDGGVGDEGQTEVESQWQILVGAQTYWRLHTWH